MGATMSDAPRWNDGVPVFKGGVFTGEWTDPPGGPWKGAEWRDAHGNVMATGETRGELVGSDNATLEVWRSPEMNAIGPPQLDAWSFGIIMVWAMVLAAFLSDFCWGRR